MGAEGFELRGIKFKPFINGAQPLNYLKSSIGQTLNFDISFNQKLTYKTTSGQDVIALSLGDLPYESEIRAYWRFEITGSTVGFVNQFRVGDFVAIDHKDNFWNYQGNCTFVSDSVIELAVNQIGTGEGQNTEGDFSDTVLFSNFETPELFEIRYNLGRSDRETQSNLFDGGQQIYEVQNTTAQTFTPSTGSIKNWRRPTTPQYELTNRTRDPQINGDFPEHLLVNNIDFRELDLIIPFWNEGFEENYDNGTKPNIFEGESTLKLYIELKVYLDRNKTKSPTVYTLEQEASIGWLNENGNGGFTDIEALPISYQSLQTGLNSESLGVNQSTQITANLERQTGSFSVDDVVQITLFKKTPFEEYNQSTLVNYQTYVLSSRRVPLNGAQQFNEGLSAIGQATTEINNSGKGLQLVFSHTPTTYGSTRINQGEGYILLLTVYNEIGTGECTTVLLDNNSFEINTDETGLIECTAGVILDPDSVPISPSGVSQQDGYTSTKLWLEDGVLAYWDLRQFGGTSVNSVDENTKIKSLKFQLISNKNSVKNGSTDYSNPEDFILIQEKQIAFDIVGDSDNVPIYEGNELRAFNLDDDDIFKNINVRTYGQGVGFAVIGVSCPFKISWQDWVRLQGVPADFYNADDSFNGYNKRASNYSEKPANSEFDIRAVLIAEMENKENEFSTKYAFEIPITIYNYGEDEYTREGQFADWSYEIKTFKLDGTDLDGQVLTTEDTLFQTHWINNGRTTETIFYFINRIEEAEQPNFDIWELSTLREPLENSPLQPLQGEQNLRISSDGNGGFFVESRVDFSKLSQGSSYNLSSRIGNNEQGEGDGFGFSTGFTIGFNS